MNYFRISCLFACLVLVATGQTKTERVKSFFPYTVPSFTNENIVVLDEYVVTEVAHPRLKKYDEKVPRDIERYLDSLSSKHESQGELSDFLQRKPSKLTFVTEGDTESFGEKFFFLDKGPELKNFSRRLRGGLKLGENATLYIKTGIRWDIGSKTTELYFPYRRRNVFGVGIEKDWQSSIRLLNATEW